MMYGRHVLVIRPLGEQVHTADAIQLVRPHPDRHDQDQKRKLSPDGVVRVKGNKTPPTAQIWVAKLLSMVEMLLPSKVTAAMQTTATRDSSRPYSTKEAPSSSRTNLVEAARSLVMEISPDGVDRVKGNKTPPTAQILPATLVNMSEMLVVSVLMATMQTTATRDNSRPYSTKEAPSSSRTNLVEAARSFIIEISPDGVDRVKGNKTPPTAQILPARVVNMVEMLVPSVVMATMQTTATRDS